MWLRVTCFSQGPRLPMYSKWQCTVRRDRWTYQLLHHKQNKAPFRGFQKVFLWHGGRSRTNLWVCVCVCVCVSAHEHRRARSTYQQYIMSTFSISNFLLWYMGYPNIICLKMYHILSNYPSLAMASNFSPYFKPIVGWTSETEIHNCFLRITSLKVEDLDMKGMGTHSEVLKYGIIVPYLYNERVRWNWMTFKNFFPFSPLDSSSRRNICWKLGRTNESEVNPLWFERAHLLLFSCPLSCQGHWGTSRPQVQFKPCDRCDFTFLSPGHLAIRCLTVNV